MEAFTIIQPTSPLAPYIKHYWLLKTVGLPGAAVRTVPTGMMSLIFHRSVRLLSLQAKEFQPRAFLSGQDYTFADLSYEGQVDMISVVFRPAGVRAFFRFPAILAAGERLDAGDMGDKSLSELESRIAGCESDGLAVSLIEAFLLERLTPPASHNLHRLEASLRLIHSGENDIDRLAEAACLSHKQFSRVFADHIGTTPKEFARIIRFQRALQQLEQQPELLLTTLACDCHYYDQSHMIKEFKTLSGYTPRQYLATCPPHSDYFDN